MECYGIVLKRGQKTKKGEYKLSPVYYEIGEIITKEDGTKRFLIDNEEFKLASDESSLNDKTVVSFIVPVEKISRALAESNIFDDDYVELFYSTYFDYVCSFNFFQKYDELGNLKKYLFEKPAEKVIYTYEDIDVLKSFIKEEFGDGETKTIESEAKEKSKDEPKEFDIKNLYVNVTNNVIGQNKQVRRILGVISKNQCITNPKLKQNILVAGPTGTGKTEIFRQIAKAMDLPITVEDATKYTVTGYVGADVDEMIVHLISKAKGDQKKAERGIIVIDEIDKKADKEWGSKVATAGVLESLLKFMDGDVINVSIGRNSTISFDTSKLTIAAVGAFSGLDKTAKEKLPTGFGREKPKDLGLYSTENFDKFGILPEFIGRCKTKVMLNDLTEENLIEIMHKKECSPIYLNRQHWHDRYGVDLVVKEEAITEIAKAAKKLKTNARGLFSVIEEMIADADFEVQANPGVYSRVELGKEAVYDNSKYLLERKNR